MLVCAAILSHTTRISIRPMHAFVAKRTYWKRPIVSLISPDEYSYSFLLWPKMITATSTEQRTDSSCAFLKRPPLRLRNVLRGRRVSFKSAYKSYNYHRASTYTDRFLSSLIALISILRRPMLV